MIYLIIFFLGFFSITAQTLLFRLFFQTYDGNELGLAAFFGSWLLWVAVGAVLSILLNKVDKITNFKHNMFGLLIFLYIPAYILQYYLLNSSRALAGVSSLEVFPYLKMFGLSFLLNAPVSIVTGFLFATACHTVSSYRQTLQKEKTNVFFKWILRSGPVNTVFVLESLGSFIGGISVTLLLYFSVSESRIFLLSILFLSLSSVIFYRKISVLTKNFKRRIPTIFSVIIFIVTILILVSSSDKRWDNHQNEISWQRFLPKQSYLGSFSTASGTYRYGKYQDSFVIQSQNSITDTIPNLVPASDIAAIHLAQRPNINKVLILGDSNISLCARFLDLAQIEKVTWLCSDPEYQKKILSQKEVINIFPILKSNRLFTSKKDIRTYLNNTADTYDLIIINYSGPITSVINRYFTSEFYQLLRTVLTKDGVVGVRFQAQENYISPILAKLGSTILTTLNSVFPYQTLKPGEESWCLASESPLTTNQLRLKANLSSIPELVKFFPIERISSLYKPDRTQFQLARYNKEAPAKNSDRNPRVYLFGLLFESSKTGRLFSGLLSIFQNLKFKLILLAGFFFLFGRTIYLYALYPKNILQKLTSKLIKQKPNLSINFEIRPSVFNYTFIISSIGLIGMTLQIILMFYFQTLYGSVFLYVGLISSLFMFGLVIGSYLLEKVKNINFGNFNILYLIQSIHIIYVLILFAFSEHQISMPFFISFFFLSGFLGGLYIPIFEKALKSKQKTQFIGMSVEMSDHIGGTIGAILTGLFFLPVFGYSATLLIIVFITIVNIIHNLITNNINSEITNINTKYPRLSKIDKKIRSIGMIIVFICFFLVAVSALNKYSEKANSRISFKDQIERKSQNSPGFIGNYKVATLSSGKAFNYFERTNETQTTYIFETKQLSLPIIGYGGEFNLMLEVVKDGRLIDVSILESFETPFYLNRVQPWLKKLMGKTIFSSETNKRNINAVDAVSGSTMTSKAILNILEEAGHLFASNILKKTYKSSTRIKFHDFPNKLFYLIILALIITALAFRLFPNNPTKAKLRTVFLVLVVVIAGYKLNAQYSLSHVFSFIYGEWSAITTISFLLATAIPITVLIFGNIYCGYLCPYGAFQELINDLIMAFTKRLSRILNKNISIQVIPPNIIYRYARTIKYLIFFLLCLIVVSGYSSVLKAGPLQSFFRFPTLFTIILLAVSIFIPRFWCRILCPMGAFLSLLTKFTLFPDKKGIAPNHCDLGVQTQYDLDCITCDRCKCSVFKHPKITTSSKKAITFLYIFIIVFTSCYVWKIWQDSTEISLIETHERKEDITTTSSQGQKHAMHLPGIPRNINLQQIRDLINTRKLSNQKAMFFKKIE
jgi:predicted membrane-bound spermidine synthase/Na+-translocating ferredoxin:NAD+ oxidoreductase RnfG subunit